MIESARAQEVEKKVEKTMEVFGKAFNRFASEEMRLIWS